VRDLAIDPISGDLSVVNGAASLTSGAQAVAQRLKIRLGLWQGEYQLDQRVGIPYASLLGTKDTVARPGGPARLESILRAAARSCPGIASLDAFRMDLTPDRHATVTLSARTIDGEPVSLAAFDVGALPK
jgi:hypothetical protein